MNWDDVRVFLAVARSGQILGAARTLGLNHATVARRLSALEAALGVRLLVRRTNGSDLTPAGERFLPQAEAIESATLLAAEAVGSDSTIAGTVRIGAPDGFGVGFLAGRLPELLARHPDLRVELVPVPRAFSLSRREADIAVTLERPREGRLVASKLTDYRLGLYASRAYLEAAGTPELLADLPRHTLVGYVEDLLYSDALDYTAAFHKDWQSRLAVSSALGQLQAVRGGAGIGILHRFMAVGAPELVPVLPDEQLRRTYWIVMHEQVRAIRRIGLVADFVREAVTGARHIF